MKVLYVVYTHNQDPSQSFGRESAALMVEFNKSDFVSQFRRWTSCMTVILVDQLNKAKCAVRTNYIPNWVYSTQW